MKVTLIYIAAILLPLGASADEAANIFASFQRDYCAAFAVTFEFNGNVCKKAQTFPELKQIIEQQIRKDCVKVVEDCTEVVARAQLAIDGYFAGAKANSCNKGATLPVSSTHSQK